MTRELIVKAVKVMARIFYRRVEVSGAPYVPKEGPLLIVANHNNSLVDPMLVLATLDRPVVFVAKSTLWKIPLLKTVLKTLGVVPIVRKVDVEKEGEPSGGDRNEASFKKLAEVLHAGGAVLIFPEGRSHSEPSLSPIRTGAARIVLQAGVPVTIVPLGMLFTRKQEFHSDVLLKYRRPLEPKENSVEAITEAIREGLAAVTLNAASWEEHAVVRAVEAIYGEKLIFEPRSLDRSFKNRRLLLQARKVLEPIEPGAVASLARRARAFERMLRRIGFSPAQVDELPSSGKVLGYTLRAVLRVVLGFPIAALGFAAFVVPYRLTGTVAKRAGHPDYLDQLALVKILAGLVLFPATLAVEVWAVYRLLGFVPAGSLAAPASAAAAIGAAVLLPLCGLYALSYLEKGERDERRLRGLLGVLFAPDRIAYLRHERDVLHAECDRLAALYRTKVGEGAPGAEVPA